MRSALMLVTSLALTALSTPVAADTSCAFKDLYCESTDGGCDEYGWCEPYCTETSLARDLGPIHNDCVDQPIPILPGVIFTVGGEAEQAIDSLPNEDDDDYPDILEATLCGRELVRGVINQLPAGECRSAGDYDLETGPVVEDAREDAIQAVEDARADVDQVLEDAGQAVADAEDLVLGAIDPYADLVWSTLNSFRSIIDEDLDGVPDMFEPTICAWENKNYSTDGTCVGADYSPGP